MRAVWLLAACLLLAGCGTQQPAPPPGDDAGTGTSPVDDEGPAGEEPDGNDTGQAGEDNGTAARERSLELASPAFEPNGTIPTEHTADGTDASPPLNVTGVPEAAETLALVVDDPDAPRAEPWVHWLLWNVPASAGSIPAGYPPSGDADAFEGARQGSNSFPEEDRRYRGPAPPEGDEPHRYRFTLLAVDVALELEEGANRTQLEDALDGHRLERARLVGLYGR